MQEGGEPAAGSDDNMETTMVMAKMRMNFYWGHEAVVLFSGWPGGSLGWYFVALLFVFLLAVVTELLSSPPPLKLSGQGQGRVAASRLRDTAAHTLRTGLNYLLMLSVMSFNLGVFIVVVTGHGVGFFIARNRGVDLTDHRTTSTGLTNNASA
ncbi:hypothetical protein SAY87_014820 [Trapa incisa]|uniref:Copper transport protein n=1 Tax=Trapa incisa TaxID=236973 RepID=A0AAN7GT86_9MYRT|nr:hypothetical protein SAY87_014820 [Trapa incisa]